MYAKDLYAHFCWSNLPGIAHIYLLIYVYIKYVCKSPKAISHAGFKLRDYFAK